MIQSFEIAALERYEQLSDLPLVMLVWYPWENPDWTQVSRLANGVGVGPKAQHIFNPDVLSDKREDWDTSVVSNDPSSFVSLMHSLGLAVHPFTLQDDKLIYRKSAYEETKLYVDVGIDGIFCEFPQITYTLLQSFGSKSNWHSRAAEVRKLLAERQCYQQNDYYKQFFTSRD